jgi:hypothetical protein
MAHGRRLPSFPGMPASPAAEAETVPIDTRGLTEGYVAMVPALSAPTSIIEGSRNHD